MISNTTINELLSGLDVDITNLSDAKTPITGIGLDSRIIKNGNIFVSLDNTNKKFAYITQAINAGASFVLVDKNIIIKDNIITLDKIILVADLASNLALLAKRIYVSANTNKIIAITGTNGKSTTCFLIMQLLNFILPQSAATIGTIGVKSSDKNTIFTIKSRIRHTTPDIFTLYEILNNLSNYKYIILEASSHALEQQRLSGLLVETAVFTNLSHDHLDYHTTMVNYGASKQKLFLRNELKNIIINRDDDFGKKLLATTNNVTKIAYGIDNNLNTDWLTFDNYNITTNGFLCTINGVSFTVPLLGKFNLYNTLAAVAVLLSLDFTLNDILGYLPQIQAPTGRMQQIANKPIWVDFAHTPDALEQSLTALKSHYPQHNIVVVFGCGGDRDKDKRQQMGYIADKLANKIILTSDNSRNEATKNIIASIKKGIANTDKVQIITDRKQAIINAIKQLTNKQCLLIAGKGNEEIQVINDVKIPLNDIDIATNAINNIT